MLKDTRTPWILAGYELFAKEGPKGLKIEVMSRMVNKNKSSFYHHFADLEVFTEFMLKYHLEKAKIIAERGSNCKNVIPQLINLFLEFKEDLFFNRQLRINRNDIEFKDCFEKTSKLVGDAMAGIWGEAIGLADNSSLAKIILSLSMDNFFLQITEETFSREWFSTFMDDINELVREFKIEGWKKMYNER